MNKAERAFVIVVSSVFMLFPPVQAQRHPSNSHTLAINPVQSGRAVLRCEAGSTTFVLTSPRGETFQVPLVHKDLFGGKSNPPFEASVIAENPGQLLIFTDTFASNPSGGSHQCGAGEELYLHVLSLTQPVHESLSVLVDSCWQSLESSGVEFDQTSRTLSIGLNDSQVVYHVSNDNSVTGGETKKTGVIQ